MGIQQSVHEGLKAIDKGIDTVSKLRKKSKESDMADFSRERVKAKYYTIEMNKQIAAPPAGGTWINNQMKQLAQGQPLLSNNVIDAKVKDIGQNNKVDVDFSKDKGE